MQVSSLGEDVIITTDNDSLIAEYSPTWKGAKGRIGIRVDNALDCLKNGYPCFMRGENYYKIIEAPLDFATTVERLLVYAKRIAN